MWLSHYPKTFSDIDVELFLGVDLWGLSRGVQDYHLEFQVRSSSRVVRLGVRRDSFGFFNFFLGGGGKLPLVDCEFDFPF